MKICPICGTDYPKQQHNCPTDGAILIESKELDLPSGFIVHSKYRIVRKLGQGGMGVVYLADDVLLGLPVALKFLTTEAARDPVVIKRFRNEARAAFLLRHPNIAEVVSLDQIEDGSFFIVMEYIDGPCLCDAIGNAPNGLPIDRVLRIVRGIALGLGAAHANGTVHRDIKPENIMLVGFSDQPKILDFGIATVLERSGVQRITNGGLLLTEDYASPEQWHGRPGAELDGRTDLYALGGVFYEMLTGRTPFHSHTRDGWMFKHLQEIPVPPSHLRPELADYPGLDALVLRLLEKERDRRPADVRQFLDELARVAAKSAVPAPLPITPKPHPEEVKPPTPIQPLPDIRGFVKSRTTLWVMGAMLIVAALIGFSFLANQKNRVEAAVPSLSPSAGTYDSAQPVAIEDSTPGAEIHYTLDGTPPSESSPVYSQPLTGLRSGTVVRAMATASGYAHSSDITGVYVWSTQGNSYAQGKASYDREQYAQARTLFSQACESGEMRACNYLGYLYAKGLGGARNSDQAHALYQKACDQGVLSSCASLGSLFQIDGNPARAREYFQKACNGGLKESCDLLHAVK